MKRTSVNDAAARTTVCAPLFFVLNGTAGRFRARLRCTTHCWLFGDAAVAAAYYFIVRPHSFICTIRYFAVLAHRAAPNVFVVHTQCAAHTHTHIHSTMKEMNDNERRRIEKKRVY